MKKLVAFLCAALFAAPLTLATNAELDNWKKYDAAYETGPTELVRILKADFDAVRAGTTLGTGSITTTHILDGTILAADFAVGAVTTTAILNNTILSADFAVGAVDTAAILNNTILAADFAVGAVDSAAILDGTVATVDIAALAVTDAKINVEKKLSPDTATKLNFKDFGVLTATVIYDPAATTDVCTESAAIAVATAAVGDMVLVEPLTLNPTGNVWWEGRVSTAGNVIIKVCSHGLVDLASDTWNITVIPF